MTKRTTFFKQLLKRLLLDEMVLLFLIWSGILLLVAWLIL
jgi:hypothetical protein